MDGLLKLHYNMENCTYFNMYKKALIDHQSFRLAQTKLNDSIVQNITQKLGKHESQYEGLSLLCTLLDQCSLDIIEQKGNAWIATCIKICIQHNKESMASLSYNVLGIFVKKSYDVPELSKSFASNYIGKIYETLNYVHPNSYYSVLKCLFICLKAYPNSCGGSSRNLIENFLIQNFLDCKDLNIIELSGKCLHLMQQVKGGGVQSVNCKTSWKIYQLRLLSSLHNIFDLIFANCPEFYEFEEYEVFGVLNLYDDPVNRVGQLFTRFKNLINYLIITIREPFPAPKLVLPKKILNLIRRGLNITCTTLKMNPILDNVAVGAVLLDIHVELYKLLEALILTLGNHLNVFYEQILGIFVDTLKWTSFGKSEGFKKPYSNLRVIAYKTLSVWCKNMKFASCVEYIFDNIFKEIDNDITPFRNEITLQVLSGSRKHMSKKARRQLNKAQNERTRLGQTYMKNIDPQNTKTLYNDNGNKDLCFAALSVLKDILNYSSSFLKPINILKIQEKIIEICLTLNDSNINTKVYSNSLCRQMVYEVLSSLAVTSHFLCPAPMSLIINFLVTGQINDYNESVRNCCANNLKYLENILHPKKKTLHFPFNINDFHQDRGSKRSKQGEEYNSDSNPEDEEEENEESSLLDNQIEIFTNNTSTSKDIENQQSISKNNIEVLNENIGRKTINEKDNETVFTDIDETDKSNSSENILDDNKKSISCPKKRLLHSIQYTNDNNIPDKDIVAEHSPKRLRSESEIIEITEKIPICETDQNSLLEDNKSNLSDAFSGTETLFDEILATFSDELKDH